jgi:hypothetical protein
MKAWIVRLSIASAALFPLACGDDDGSDGPSDPSAGAGGTENPGGSGGTPSAGAGGTPSAGAGGMEPVTCEPPAPPAIRAGGEGGAAAVGGAGNGGAGTETSAGSGNDGGSEGLDPLVIAGEYTDNFGGDHTITSAEWLSGGFAFNISAFDNEEQWVLARNDQENAVFPCLWSRFDWTESDGKLYFCQSAFAAESVEAAAAVLRPDTTAPSTRGCGAFAWSELIAK